MYEGMGKAEKKRGVENVIRRDFLYNAVLEANAGSRLVSFIA